jgi:accessory gene regulator B
MKDPIDILSNRISRYKFFRRQKSAEVTEYIYAIGINMVGVMLLTAFLGQLLGVAFQAVMAMMSFFVLRKFSGGFHFKSLTICLIVTVLLFTVIPFIRVSDFYIQLLNAASILLIVLFAPNNLKQVPAIFKSPLKVISGIIVIANFFIIDSNIALAFFSQALLLIPTREVKS